MALNIGLLKMAGALASHAAQRQGLIAENMANADTPGYKARDLVAFSKTYNAQTANPSAMRATRPEHFGQGTSNHNFTIEETSAFGAESPNANTVSLDDQIMRSAALQIDHELALGVYTKSLSILRLGLGRR